MSDVIVIPTPNRVVKRCGQEHNFIDDSESFFFRFIKLGSLQQRRARQKRFSGIDAEGGTKEPGGASYLMHNLCFEHSDPDDCVCMPNVLDASKVPGDLELLQKRVLG